MSICFSPCCFNVPYQSTALLNLHSPFGFDAFWLAAYNADKNLGKLRCETKLEDCVLTANYINHCSLPIYFISCSLFAFKFFVLPTNATVTYPMDRGKMTMTNLSNLSGSNSMICG